jgi:hypothetical protein
MKPPSQQGLWALLGFALVAFAAFGLYKLIILLWQVFSHVNPAVGAGIIAASATILVSVISVLISKRIDQKNLFDKENRDKKIPFYENFIHFLFLVTHSEKMGKDPISEQEMLEKMISFTENLIIWGSDETVSAFHKFRMASIHDDPSPGAIPLAIEGIMYAIRKDLGHKNKNLHKGTLLGLFINDIDQHISP